MFCVIQKIENKKSNIHGSAREIISSSFTFGVLGEPQKRKYTYHHSEERFERPIKTAYKISIHKSYRENGKVKKQQWSICTISYYDLLEFSLYDCADRRIGKLSELIDFSIDDIYDMILKKLDPIEEKVKSEYSLTKEYKAEQNHKKIIDTHRKVKIEFEKLYGDDTYDYCYDVFGTLRNEEYIQSLIQQRENKEAYEKQQRSYQRDNQSNYSNYDYSSYFTTKTSTYNESEKKMLKKIYRESSKKFHPDIFNDDGSMMKFLTKLKGEWGI